MIRIAYEPIDSSTLLDEVTSPLAGAVVLFLGATRSLTGSCETVSLNYECYQEMAERKLIELEAEARRRWPLVGCAIVHRLGTVLPAETSVAVAVSSPHRAEAFAAGQWIIDTLKAEVPIWKQEHGVTGAATWVHPGMNTT